MVKASPQQQVYTQQPASTQPSAPQEYGETQFQGTILNAPVIYSQTSNIVEKSLV